MGDVYRVWYICPKCGERNCDTPGLLMAICYDCYMDTPTTQRLNLVIDTVNDLKART